MTDLFIRVLNMSIAAGWIVLAVVVLRLLLHKAPRWIMVALWGIVALRLICPFSLESVLSLIPSAQTVSPEIMMDPTPTIESGVPIVNSTVNPIIESTLTPHVGDSVNPLQIWLPVAATLWLAGMAALLVYTVVSYLRLRYRVSTAVRLRDNVFLSERVESPFVLGVVRPKIYLPYGISAEDMQNVIAHEQAHISRRDHWIKPFGFLLLTVHWFNPLVWWGYVLLCRDIELACDQKVVQQLPRLDRAAYSEALLRCAVRRRTIAACPLAFGEVGVKNRIKAVLSYKKPTVWILAVAILAGTVAGVCFLTNPLTTDDSDMSAEGVYNGQTITMSYKVTDVVYPWDMRSMEMSQGYAVFYDYTFYDHERQTNPYPGDTWNIMDRKGNVLCETPYMELERFNKDGITVAQKQDGTYVQLNTKLEETPITEQQYLDFCEQERENNVCSETYLKEVSQFVFVEDGLALYVERRENIQYVGLVDANGNVIIPAFIPAFVSNADHLHLSEGVSFVEDFSSQNIGIITLTRSDVDPAQADALKSVAKLRELYPQFFGLSADDGLLVYIWQMAEENYRCYLTTKAEDAVTDQSFAFSYQESASITDMRTILATYPAAQEDITIRPVQNPLSSHHYEIDAAYTQKVKERFWAVELPFKQYEFPQGGFASTIVLDGAPIDMDGDGKLEYCVLRSGITSGVFTFSLAAYDGCRLVYSGIYASPVMEFQLMTPLGAPAYLQGITADKYVRRMDFSIDKRRILLLSDEQDIQYLGELGEFEEMSSVTTSSLTATTSPDLSNLSKGNGEVTKAASKTAFTQPIACTYDGGSIQIQAPQFTGIPVESVWSHKKFYEFVDGTTIFDVATDNGTVYYEVDADGQTVATDTDYSKLADGKDLSKYMPKPELRPEGRLLGDEVAVRQFGEFGNYTQYLYSTAGDRLSGAYDSIGYFYNGLALVTKDKKVGLIDEKGNEVLTPSIAYDTVSYGQGLEWYPDYMFEDAFVLPIGGEFAVIRIQRTATAATTPAERLYASLLDDLKKEQIERYYALKDIDGNHMKELLIKEGTTLHVYTYQGGVKYIGKHDFSTGTLRMFSSDDYRYPGIFYFTVGGGVNHYDYLTIKNNHLSFENLWEDRYGLEAEDSSERIKKFSSDEDFIAESKRLYDNDCDMHFTPLRE